MVWSLLVIAGLGLYFMNQDERVRLAHGILSRMRRAQDGARRLRSGPEPLQDTLRARTPWAIVTPALVALHVVVFAAMVLGPGEWGAPQTLEQLGGNFAPRTTNGEWGRLVTSTFVHGGIVHLAVNLAALVSVGLLLERLVGPLTFLGVYVSAGVLAGLASLGSSFTSVSVGSSGAIFGLYGLLVASWAHGTIQNATTTVRLATVRRLAPVAAVFIVYNLTSERIDTAAECAGVVAGFVAGVVLGRHVRDGRPPAFKVAVTMASAAVIAILSAAPLVGITDVRPVIAEVIALEKRTDREYDAAVAQFRKGRMTARELAAVIDERIMPEVRHTRVLLEQPRKLPAEHRALITAADKYLRLNQESWRLRSAALQKGNTAQLREAEAARSDALQALAALTATVN